MELSLLASRHSHLAMAALAVIAAGCAATGPYIVPAATNPVAPGAYTRAETIPAGQRLVAALLADPVFAQHRAAKSAARGGAAPTVQVAYFRNLTSSRVQGQLDTLRGDIEAALRSSGQFVLSGDPDACDYILKGDYRVLQDGARMTHVLSLRLHDLAADTDVWIGSDEIAKEISAR
jgi:hypothetical protein